MVRVGACKWLKTPGAVGIAHGPARTRNWDRGSPPAPRPHDRIELKFARSKIFEVLNSQRQIFQTCFGALIRAQQNFEMCHFMLKNLTWKMYSENLWVQM